MSLPSLKKHIHTSTLSWKRSIAALTNAPTSPSPRRMWLHRCLQDIGEVIPGGFPGWKELDSQKKNRCHRTGVRPRYTPVYCFGRRRRHGFESAQRQRVDYLLPRVMHFVLFIHRYNPVVHSAGHQSQSPSRHRGRTRPSRQLRPVMVY